MTNNSSFALPAKPGMSAPTKGIPVMPKDKSWLKDTKISLLFALLSPVHFAAYFYIPKKLDLESTNGLYFLSNCFSLSIIP